jgi:hypothetical protein
MCWGQISELTWLGCKVLADRVELDTFHLCSNGIHASNAKHVLTARPLRGAATVILLTINRAKPCFVCQTVFNLSASNSSPFAGRRLSRPSRARLNYKQLFIAFQDPHREARYYAWRSVLDLEKSETSVVDHNLRIEEQKDLSSLPCRIMGEMGSVFLVPVKI